MTEQNRDNPITWDHFVADAAPELQKLQRQAEQDVWWTWPEAIAWVATRNTANIATLRHWRNDGWGGGADVGHILNAQVLMAQNMTSADFPAGKGAEAELYHALRDGKVVASGRKKIDAAASDLPADSWRGGTATSTGAGIDLVSEEARSTVWAFDVQIKRVNLIAAFPAKGTAAVSGGEVPANRKLNYEKIRADVAAMRIERPNLSKGAAAASIVADLGNNPRTGKPWCYRHIERIIAPMWEGGLS